MSGPDREAAKSPNAGSMARAAAINLGFALVTIIIQLTLFGILGRLLTPQDYGVFAFANAILVYVAHLSQRGLSASLISKKTLSPTDYGSAYVMCLTMALASAILLVGLGAIVHLSLQSQRQQSALLLFMTLPLIMQIMATPAQVYLQRRLSFFAINIIQLTSICLGNGVVGILCALWGFGPWSLAFAGAAAAAVSLLLSLMLGRNSLHYSRNGPTVRRGLKDALQFNALRSLDIAWLQAPTLILGVIGSPAAVGIYQRMQFLADLGMQLTVWRITSVLYAALAGRGDGATIDKNQYRKIFALCVLLVLPIAAFVLFATENIILVLLGDQWISGVTTLRVLIVTFGLTTINHAASMALEHAGKLRTRLLQSATALSLIVIFIFALNSLGPQYYAVPSLLSIIASTALLHIGVGDRWTDIPRILSSALPGAILFAAVSTGTIATPPLLARIHADAGPTLELLAQFVFSLALCAACLPLLFKTRALAPFVAAYATSFPGLFGKTRFLHRANLSGANPAHAAIPSAD